MFYDAKVRLFPDTHNRKVKKKFHFVKSTLQNRGTYFYNCLIINKGTPSNGMPLLLCNTAYVRARITRKPYVM